LYERLLARWQAKWWETPADVPLACVADTDSKKTREAKTDAFIKAMGREAEGLTENGADQQTVLGSIFRQARAFAEQQGFFTPQQTALLFSGGFMKATRDFLREVSDFDPELGWADAFQALRNVWIMNTLQLLFGLPVRHTPAVFGYSMLYPYTDNFLDDQDIASREKEHFNTWLQRRLQGKRVLVEGLHRQRVNALVERIEGVYPRSQYPLVYEALLGIQKGQTQSMGQQQGASPCYLRDILGISMLKGGMSVLADAYLIQGTLTEAQADFAFGFGVVLQLADDLQDVREDGQQGHLTIFSHNAGRYPLDALICRLLHMTWDLGTNPQSWMGPDGAVILDLIRRNCTQLILKAVSENRRYFTPQGYSCLEGCAPYSFRYMSRMDVRLRREWKTWVRRAGGADRLQDLSKLYLDETYLEEMTWAAVSASKEDNL